jgi:glycolate oxidase
MDTDVIRALRTALDDPDGAVVRTDAAALDASRSDRSGWTADGTPLAVVRARTVADVQAVLRVCSATGTPVVPRGAGTGLAGAAAGTDGSVVLDLSGMDRILEIDADEGWADVEPGVLNADLDAAAREHGRMFAPDPASRAIATVGGNIATNAGGLRCVKYGVTREAVLGLDVVLADGSLIRTGRRTVKGVTGLDVTALIVGSEGTLGVVVGATVRLVPLPTHEPRTIAAVFPDVVSAAAGASALMRGATRPSTLELLDGTAVAAIGDLLGPEAFAATSGHPGAFLLVEYDGPDATEAARGAVTSLQAGGADVRFAADAAERELLLDVRRSFHPAMERRGRVLIEDVAVPRNRLAEMFAATERIGREHGVLIATVAHAGDGNLHPNLVFDDVDSTIPPRVWAAADALFRAAIGFGGTLTGEHGVGVLKRRWLADELGDEQLALQRRIKAAFDPAGILNPGKAV